MRWDFIVEYWAARLQGDAALTSLMDSSRFVYPAQSARPVKVGSVEYSLIYDREEELFNKIGVQVDFWARGIKKAAQVERRIRRLTHRDVAQVLGGERLWMRYVDGRTVDYPADKEVIHGILDFEFEAWREKYVLM